MNATDIAGLQDLRVEIGGRALVDGVSLRLAPGKITALIGASGSGKTTTGLALLHEYPPGAVVVGEVNVPDALIGYVPQHPATVLNPARPVAALLQDIARTQVRHLPRRARRSAARHRVLRALDRAQLPDGETLLHRYPHQLSGGQQQRVVLAQALLTGATTLIADEPTTGQDALTKQQITAQLAALARQGLAILLLSHDLEVVHALADDVHVMRVNRIVESGPPEELRLSPGTPGPANSSPRPIQPSRRTVCLRTATPSPRTPSPQAPPPQDPAHGAEAPRAPRRPGPRTSGAGPHRPPRQDHRPAPHRSPPPAGLHGRRGPLGQRQNHPRPLSGRSPPDLRRGGPARRCRTAPQPA